ncbi:hypothetical protein AGMMS50230_07890 [Spirochaetia bacterium]|nr:hypothetical protein AGMMS50230_07890 [Spirochaetia bacterium]
MPPPVLTVPALRIQDYKNREGPMAPWLHSYLEGGLSAAELLPPYKGLYLFVARIYSFDQAVVSQWLEHFSPERDFSRLVSERIRARLEEVPPAEQYGAYYDETVKAAYLFSFRGVRRLDDSWVQGTVSAADSPRFPAEPMYWGFILMSIPKDTLEIQVSGLLDDVENSIEREHGRRAREASREHRTAFANVKEQFFEHF